MTWRLSVNVMSNGPMPAINSIDWLWYAFNTKRKRVVAYTFGPRNDKTCRRLLSLLSPFQIGFITSDDWGSYAREVPSEMHLTGKTFTQRIERNNLTLRTRRCFPNRCSLNGTN